MGPAWTHNPDLSHGLFAPIAFVLLVREARRQGPSRWLAQGPWRSLAIAATLAAAVLLLVTAGLLAASVGWSHALVEFVLAAALAAYLGAALLVLSGRETGFVPFNWISLTAIGLWLLAAPLPHGTYARITLALQGEVTSGVMQVLHWLGIPARQRGNVIELAHASVGVEEACSGIRSLLSCTYAGFFFAAWQVRGAARRIALIVIAPCLAIAMNFLRSLILTLLANHGTDISNFWHDATGYAILAVTAGLLGGIALALGRESPRRTGTMPSPVPGRGTGGKTPVIAFWFGTAAAGAVGGFFLLNARPSVRADAPVPDIAALLPVDAEGWTVLTARDLYRFSSILQTDHLCERTYLKGDGDNLTQLTVYVAYWRAGQAPVSLVVSHTPDACWPGAGWTPSEVDDRRVTLSVPGVDLAPAEHRLFANALDFRQNVWFWHVYDGRVINYRDPYSVPALLRIALQYGFSRDGDQFFVRMSSNRRWDELAHEPLVREILSNLSTMGI